MTERRDEARSRDTDNSGAPIDSDRLDAIADRLSGGERFDRVEDRPPFAPDRILCRYESGFYPNSVHRARLEIVWYENGDFSLHYHEELGRKRSIIDGTDTRQITTRVITCIRARTPRRRELIRPIRTTGATSSRWHSRRFKLVSKASGRTRCTAVFDRPSRRRLVVPKHSRIDRRPWHTRPLDR